MKMITRTATNAAVPWDAYDDPSTLPTQTAVQAVMRERQLRPAVHLPSVPPGG